MIVTNFSLIDFQNGNVLGEADLDALFGGIHTVLGDLIFNNEKTPLLPDSFTGNNIIPAVINNSLFSINGSGDVVLVSKQSLDDSVAAAAASAASAAVSAASALEAALASATSATNLSVTQASKSLTLTQTGKPFSVGMYVTIVDVAAPTTRWLLGAITAFNSSTGAMTVNVTAICGSGSASNWAISASSPILLQGILSAPQIVSAGTVSASSGGHYVLTYAAGVTTVTLPATANSGDELIIDNFTGRFDVVISRNGLLLMGLAEDMTMNAQWAIKLRYIDTARGWRFV